MTASPQFTYWQYTNNMYELKETFYKDGRKVQAQRNIFGPITQREMLPLIRGTEPIAKEDPEWQAKMVARLAREHFNTHEILKGVDNPHWPNALSWRWVQGFWQENKLFCCAVSGVLVGGVALVFLGPKIYEKFGPQVAEQLEEKSETKEKEETETKTVNTEKWAELRKKLTPELVSGLLGTCGILVASLALFNRIQKEIKEPTFSRWQERLIQQVIKHPKNGEEYARIPEALKDDPILSQNKCPLTQEAIRVPCRSTNGRCSHLFEEAVVKAYFQNQVANGAFPTCPQCRRDLAWEHLTVDYRLSDTIELRVLHLMVHQPLNQGKQI